ncbi:unnamed protein product [Caenorhabditis sp. 36 PRJEB53466]|nr:unnamed protein product [Caenorhabditis sp. 36 PRJEB53466]
MFGQNKSFGSSSFGSNTGSGLFGQNNQNKGLFGQSTAPAATSSLFGSNQNKPAGSSLFGGASNTSSNLFGSPQPQNQSSSLFGGQNNANRSLFGGSTTTTSTAGGGLFGANTNTSNAGTSSLFGSNTASSGGGLFGGSAVTGTTIKFEPPISSDTMMRNGSTQTISTKHICISAMTKYEQKSMEELRVEDYMANRKTPGTGTTTTGGNIFGSTTTNANQSGSTLFGSNTQQKSSLFGGATTSSPFGGNTSGGTSLFGNNNAANTSTTGSSLFGAKPAGSSLFGATTGASTFGQNTGSSLFGGNQQNATGGSLFGQTQNQNQSGSLFASGNTSNTGTNLFGQNSQQQPQQQSGFNFGGAANTTNAFGQPAAANTGGSLFGNTSANTGGSLFGAKPATSTGGFNFGGNQPTTTNAFGTTNTTGGGLFGNTAAKPGGLFGNTTTTGATGGLFGSQPQATTGSLFGSNTQATQPLSTGFGNAAQPQVVVQQQVAPIPVIGVPADILQMQANMKSLQSQLTNAPYGDSALLKYNTAPESEGKGSQINAQRQIRFLAAKKGALTVGSPSQESSFIVPPISKVMSDLSPAVNRSSDITRDLNYTSREAPPTLGRGLRTGSYNPNSSLVNQSLHDTSAINRTIDSAIDASLNGSSNRLGVRGSVRRSNLKQLDLSVLSDSSRVGPGTRAADPDALPRIAETSRRPEIVASTPQVDPVQAVVQRHQDRNKEPPALNLDTTCDEYTGIEPVSAASSVASVVTTPTEETAAQENMAAGVRLSKPDYFSLPTINEMKSMVKNGRVVLEDGLTIGRSSYGSVFWPGKIELKDVVLDEIVIFRHREVTVYPNEEEKPAEGQELNKPAEVTLERIWYTDKKTKKEVRDVVKLAEVGWREHLERQTTRMGATFKDFRAETGSWVFRVEHFSKYGLADDDEPMDVAPPLQQPPQQPEQTASPLRSLDLNTSGNDVNSQVQRKKIYKEVFLHEMLAERVPAPAPLASAVQIVRHANPGGLGGGKTDKSREDGRIADMTTGFEESVIIEDGEQPEKKPKLEFLADLEYESSRFIRNLQDLKVMPKSREPTNQFNGGREERKMLGFGRSKTIDLGVAKGRSARVGWSENGCLVWSAQPVHNHVLFGTLDRTSDVDDETLVAMIEVNVQVSETRRKGPSTQTDSISSSLVSNFATYSDSFSTMFNSYIDIAQTGGYDGHASVWQLLAGLFPSERREGWSFERGERIGEWLKTEAKKRVMEWRGPREEAAVGVWRQLCIGDVEKAFQLANENGHPKLASILHSSAVCPEATVHCFKAQIENWKKCEVLHLVPKSLLKCYVLMSGVSHFDWTHEGQKHSINCLEGLHWTQALGLHVWFLRNWTGLEDAYSGYQQDVVARRAASNRGDLHGELIKLACESQHSLEVVLDCAAGEMPHDHFLQWHIWSVLYSVGYRTMSKTAETRLHRSYSAQLEAAKLSTYAVFVMQHIDEDEERATAVRSLLDRIARFTDNETFNAISEQFDIPSEWIAQAQFTITKSSDDSTQLFELAIAAKNLLEIRRLFVDDIAPTAVVAGDSDSLKTVCLMVRPFENQIPEWGASGMIYMDYCRLIDLLENDVDESNLQEVLDSLETRLHAPSITKNTIQKLALQTIGRHLFEYRADKNSLPEWTKLLGHRQMFKIFRDRSSWGIERFTIEFE